MPIFTLTALVLLVLKLSAFPEISLLWIIGLVVFQFVVYCLFYKD